MVDSTPENVPPLMTTAAGADVRTVADWEQVRRPELMELFRRDYFGRRPVQRPEGLSFELLDSGKFVLAGELGDRPQWRCLFWIENVMI